MNIYKIISNDIKSKIGEIPEIQDVLTPEILNGLVVEVPKIRDFGDFSTNVAMVLAKPLAKNPRDVAAILTPYIEKIPNVASVSVAGPGFININVVDKLWDDLIANILSNASHYGDSDVGAGEKINVEFLSANPTGPIHIGHARGAIFGDVLSRLLRKNGYDVTKEYYINDFGHQVNVLANTVFWRYEELFGMHNGEELPSGSYPGDYLIPVAELIKETDGDKWLGKTADEYLTYFKATAVAEMMKLIKSSLQKIGIEFDVFTSEKGLIDSGKIQDAIKLMQDKGLLYTGTLPRPLGDSDDDWRPEEQLLFRTKDFGDDSDRVIARKNGETTYFASDIAYHLDKFERGFKKQIDVWGADHGGYVKRIRAAIGAATDNQADLKVILCQIVNLEKDGKPFKMSKRAGNFVMIEDVLEEIDADVLRLFMITKSADTQMTFDLKKASEQSKDNPVYYIQYAHARANSILKKYSDVFGSEFQVATASPNYFRDATDTEKLLVKIMGDYPSIIETAGRNRSPNVIATYLEDLARTFHSLWGSQSGVKLIVEEDRALSDKHMLLVSAMKNIIANGLTTIGVKPKDVM
jgi:arginyl-tRNA synthetase